MKLSKEELKMKINELGIDDEIKISLLEDVEDSIDISEDNSERVEKSAYDELEVKYKELLEKYKERFLKGEEVEIAEEKEDEEELKEEEVIDVKEI